MKSVLVIIMIMTMMLSVISCEIMPRNTRKDCRIQCEESSRSKACYEFCDCIHLQGQSLDSCLEVYEKIPDDQSTHPNDQ